MDAYVCDAIRTPIGRYGGTLSSIRTDDLASLPISALMQRHASLDWNALDEVIFGSANQADEDNRNVARIAALLAGLPVSVPGTTVNRLCASGMGVESMSRAPFVMPKATRAFSRDNAVYDTTIGWRFVNPQP